MSGELPLSINIKEPRWDQGTFMGRAKHFFMVTDPRNVLLSSETLEEAKVIVENYRWAPEMEDGVRKNASLWKMQVFVFINVKLNGWLIAYFSK